MKATSKTTNQQECMNEHRIEFMSQAEAEAYLAGEQALAKALATRESVAQRESYHKEGTLVLLTPAELQVLFKAITYLLDANGFSEEGKVIASQVQDKLSRLS